MGPKTRSEKSNSAREASKKLDQLKAHIRRREIDLASELIELLMANYRLTVIQTLRLARSLQDLNHTRVGIQLLYDRWRESPGSLLIFEALVEMLRAEKEYVMLGSLAEEMLRISPRNTLALMSGYEMAMRMEQTGTAHAYLTVILNSCPEDPRFLLLAAKHLIDSGNFELATNWLLEVITIAGDSEYGNAAINLLQAIDHLDLGMIIQLADEDPLFRLELLHDAAEAIRKRGFYISPFGHRAVEEMRLTEIPFIPGQFALKRYN